MRIIKRKDNYGCWNYWNKEDNYILDLLEYLKNDESSERVVGL